MAVWRDRETFCWLLIIPYVLVDAVNGFVALVLGWPTVLSAGLKLALMGALFFVTLTRSPMSVVAVSLASLVLIVTPLRQLMEGGSEALAFDLPVALRLMLFLLTLTFSVESAKRDPLRFLRLTRRTLRLGFVVVTASVLVGHLGLGLPTYQSTGLGHKGFFIAGNEVGALYIVLASFVLFELWQGRRWVSYWMITAVVIATGISLATKAGVIFGALAGLVVPLLRRPSHFLRLAPLARLTFCAVGIAGVLLLSRERITKSPAYSQFEYVYNSLGPKRLVFSGREEVAQSYLSKVRSESDAAPLLLGYGTSGLDLGPRVMVELDPVDVALMFGWPVALIGVTFGFLSILAPLRYAHRRPYAPLVVFVNALLLGLAFTAGHVWTSGMLGISWALLNGLLLVDDSWPIDRS